MGYTTATTVFGSSTNDFSSWTILWTNLGPLRKAFTPPWPCATVPSGEISIAVGPITSVDHEGDTSTSWNTFRTCGQDNEAYLSEGCIPAASAASIVVFNWNLLDVSKYSSEYWHLSYSRRSSWESTVNENYYVATYYSPGLSCPHLWHTAGKFTLPSKDASGALYTVSEAWEEDILRVGGTHVICCPSGYTQFTKLLPQLQGVEFVPIGCTSRATTRTSGDFCRDRCHLSGFYDNENSFHQTCVGTIYTSFNGSQAEQTLGFKARPLYLIHDREDLEWQPSQIRTIVPAVLVPTLSLALAILGVLFLLRRRKRKMMWKSRNAATYSVKKNPQCDNNGGDGPADNELDDNSRVELEQNVRSPPELDTDQEIREAPNTPNRLELHNIRRLELEATSRTHHQMSGAPAGEHQDHMGAVPYDNEPFETYPSAVESPVSSEYPQDTSVRYRLRNLERESFRLDEEIRRRHMADLMERKKSIDEQIAALQPR